MRVPAKKRKHHLILFLVTFFVAFACITAETSSVFAEQSGTKGDFDPFLDNGRYKITFEPQGNGSANILEYSNLKIQVYDRYKELCEPFYDGMGNTQEMWDKKIFIADFDGRKATQVDVSCYFVYGAGEFGNEGILFSGDIKTIVSFKHDKDGTAVNAEIPGAGTVCLGFLYIEAAPYDIKGTGTVNNHDSGYQIGTFEIPGDIEGLSAYPGEQVTVQFLKRKSGFEYSLQSISVKETKTEKTEEVFTTDPPNGNMQTFTFTMPVSDVRLDYCKMEPKPYIDEEGKDAKCLDYTYLGQLTKRVSGEGYSIGDVNKGWYVTSGEEDIDLDRAVCKGDVNIILADGSCTKFGRGIEVNESNEASLTIWGQKEGSGRLEAYSYYKNRGHTGVYDAAIGGGRNQKVGSITINGGIIVADADSKVNEDGSGAGIGSGEISYSGGAPIGCGSVTINGGDVTAIGGDRAAGIGGGLWDNAKARITINGGTVNASGGGAGIGTGTLACPGFGEIKITGGSVSAKSRSKEIAGIGGMSTGNTDTVTISGGTVGAEGSPAIGVSGDEETGKITISGGNVTAQGTEYGSGLRASSVIITKGTVNAYGADKGAGIGGYTESKYLNNEVQRTLNGLVEIRGGNVTAIGGDEGAGIGGTNNGDMKGSVKISGGNVTATGKSGGAGIGGGDSGELSGSVTVTGGTVKATATDKGAGIGGGDGDPLAGPVTISGGKVFAYGGDQGAGIGSARGYDQIGNITIKGGEVTATGGDKAAGLGGGDKGNGASILIEKGTVTAIGGRHGAGIGGGNEGHGGVVTVKDGTVTVNGGEYGAGIGGGEDGNGGTLTIHKGSVVVKSGGDGAGVGGGFGGEARGTVTLYNGFLSAKAVDSDALFLSNSGGGAGIGHGGLPDFSYWDPDEPREDASFIMYNGTLHATGATYAAAIGGSGHLPGINVKILGGQSFLMSGINLDRVIGPGTRFTHDRDFGDLEIADNLLVDLNGWKPVAEERIKTLRTCSQAYIFPCTHFAHNITQTDKGHKVVCKHCNGFSGKEEAHVAGTEIEEENRIEPSCTKEGSYDLMTECSVCKAKYCLEHWAIAPLGHDWDKGTVTKPAEGDQDGTMTFKCNRCKETRTEIIPAPEPVHEHDWDEGTVTIEAGCTTEGLITYKCKTCEEVNTEVVEVKGHSRLEEPEEIPVRPAECERNGYVYLFYRCSNCGESLHRQLKPIPAIVHDWGDWEFFDENQHQKVCSRDPLHTQKENHSWNEGEVIKEATASREGSCKYQCTVCGMTRTEITPPTEHNHGLTHVVAKDATCTEDGVSREYWICDQGEYACGIAFSDADATIEINPEEYVIPALGHDWGDWKVTKEATEKTAGLKTRECGRCHATLTEKLEKKPATAKVSGKQTAKMTAKGKTTVRNTVANTAKKNSVVIYDAVAGATGYDIAYKHKNSSKWVIKKVGKTTRATIGGLTVGGMYQIKVRAKKAETAKYKAATGAWSPVINRYFHTTQKIRLSSKARTSFTMSWARNSQATGYQVMFSTKKDGSGAAKNTNTVGKNATSFTKVGLKSGKTYYVQVREIKKVGGVNYIGNISKPVAVKIK